MIEDLMLNKGTNDNKPRKYHCRYNYEYSAESMRAYIDRLGKEPEKFEIISLVMPSSSRYEIFFKEFYD